MISACLSGVMKTKRFQHRAIPQHTAQHVGHTHTRDAGRNMSDLCLAGLKKMSNNIGGVPDVP